MAAKSIFKSKTLWANLAAALGIAAQAITGHYVTDPAVQGGVLAVVNMVLRLVTKQPIK